MERSEINNIFNRAMLLLPEKMDTPLSRMMGMAIGFQESKFLTRRQMGNGPARSFWQFEEGNQKSHAGVWAVLNHRASGAIARQVAEARNVAPTPNAVWTAMESDDVLGCAFARLLLWTDAQKLPDFHEEEKAWAYYIRCWNPGKPHKGTWSWAFNQASSYYTGN